MNLAKLYKNRFKEEDLKRKDVIWKILCNCFFQRYIPEGSAVLDIASGYCEFINNVRCAKKYAVDLNREIYDYANSDVKIFNYSASDLSFLPDASIDVAFISNFLEHLESKKEIITTISEVFRVLRSKGSLMIMQPNIRYVYKEYWDFFDHHIALSDKSLVEALQMSGFEVKEVIPRFLPYTTKNRAVKNPFLVRIYLNIPFIWRFFGKQMFVLAKKP